MSARPCPEGGRSPLRRGVRALLAALLVLLSAGSRASAAAISFRPPVSYDKPAAADLTAADVDGDGKLDLVVVGGGSVSVLYGNGDGTFQPRVDYPVGDGLSQVIAADVDGDGRLDLVIADDAANSVDVLINQGNRQFAAPVRYPVGAKPYGVVAGDFNGDGHLDLAVSNDNSDNMCVLLNHGDGTFAPAVFYPGGSYPARILCADLNGDSKLDLAMSNYVSANVIVYFGDGKGGFTVGGSYGVGSYPAKVLTDDFNGDGIPDLATANTFDNSISILRGDGKGGFSRAVTYPGNQYPHMMASADLDDDGAPDLVAPNNGTSYFTLLQNKGDGTFLPAVTFASGGSNTRTLTVGDFNGDGLPDVAVGNESSNNVTVFLNNTPLPTPAVRSLTLDVTNLVGGCQSASGTVTLSAPAPSVGAVVALASSNPAAAVPSEVRIPAGAAQAHFSVATGATTGVQWASISASYNGTAKRASLAIRPMGALQVVITPGQVIGGQSATGQITIPCPAGPDGLAIPLSSSSPSVSVPPAVTVPAGATTVAFSIRTDPVAAATTATLSVGPPGAAATASLQVLPLSPSPPVFTIHGATYATSDRQETLTATFTRPDGGVTANGYQGYVLLHVTGGGQSYANVYNDAFYLYTGAFSRSPQNGHDGGYYQLAFGTSPLRAFDLANNAVNFLVGPLPAYNPAHDYTFILDTTLGSLGRLHFGVSDGGYSDNTGAYTITVTQLVSGL